MYKTDSERLYDNKSMLRAVASSVDSLSLDGCPASV